jgi:hypothetical protein
MDLVQRAQDYPQGPAASVTGTTDFLAVLRQESAPHSRFWSIRDRIVGFRDCERMTSAGIRTRRPRRSHPLHVIHHVVAVEAEMSGSGTMTARSMFGFTRAAELSVRAS